MAAEPAKPTLQVVSGEGDFNDKGVLGFVKQHGIDHAGIQYQVVAITGPQSSGKSTLMNTLFGTRFEEMDAFSGRNQTTHGIWMAKSDRITQPSTMVLDLEGSDGRERGEDDTSFERQSALFALAVADVLLVNMWAKDVGRESGAGKPLLKTIFQVNLKLFQPAPNKRRTVLLFVFRDRTKTPLPRLIETWEADLARMWAAIAKPPAYEQYSFSDFFEVQYASLPNYEEREEEFKAEAVLLRRRFTTDGEESLVRVSDDKLPGHSFALHVAKIWEVIRSQKDLNLPAHKVMVANIRCVEIMNDQLRALAEDQAWAQLRASAGTGLAPGFGAAAAALIGSCITGYDEEARYFEAGVRQRTREALAAKVADAVRPVFEAQLAHLRQAVAAQFQRELADALRGGEAGFSVSAAGLRQQALERFDQGAADVLVVGTDWSAAGARQALEAELATHVSELTQQKVSEVVKAAHKRMDAAVGGPAMALLDSTPPDLWPRLARLAAGAVAKAEQAVDEGLAGYDLAPEERAALSAGLAAHARSRLDAHLHEAANTALSRMKDRFGEEFSRDEAGLPRVWGPRANIPAITRAARAAAARVLAQLAVNRLDAEQAAGASQVERAILSMAADKDTSASLSAASAGNATSNATSATTAAALDSPEARSAAAAAAAGASSDLDILAASEWPGVAEAAVLLPPGQCRTLWRQFMSDSSYAVQQAIATQEANRAASSRLPPLWAIFAMVFLGFNEFLTVLRNPLWLVLGLLIFLFCKTVYTELEVDAELQRGLLPGGVALSAKFVPVLKSVSARTVEAVQAFIADPNALVERVQHTAAELQQAVSPERQARRPAAVAHAATASADTAHSSASGAPLLSTPAAAAGLRKRREDDVPDQATPGAAAGVLQMSALSDADVLPAGAPLESAKDK